jgi:sec-independent protein translocase protein TatB
MFDFGFSEILLTSAIALVVLGPERLPKVARQVGNWMGRARVMARQLGEQLEREVSAEEFLKEQNKSAANRLMAPTKVPITEAIPAEFAPGHQPAPGAAIPVADQPTPPLQAGQAQLQAEPPHTPLAQPAEAPHVAVLPAMIPTASEPSSSADGGTSSITHE